MRDFLPVLLGGDANVYGMAHSFYETYGVRSAAVCKRALPALAYSRLLETVVQEPQLERDAVFVHTLTAFAKTQPGRTLLLLSCADGYTRLLARHRAALAGCCRFACPPPETVGRLGGKPGFAAACAELGLRTPAAVIVPPGGAAPALPFGYPVIAKPVDSPAYWNCSFPGKRKVYLAADAAALAEILRAVDGGGYREGMLVQEYIPGPDTRLAVVNAYCAQDGSVPWLVQGQPLLQESTPDGAGNYAAVLTEPARQDTALLAALRTLLQRGGWRGYANFDCKYDPHGVPVLFEMNPRQGRASYACTAAGASLARPPVEDLLLGTAVTPPRMHAGVWYTAPWAVVRRRCPDRALYRRAAVLRRRGYGAAHLLAPGEGPARRLWFAARQARYRLRALL